MSSESELPRPREKALDWRGLGREFSEGGSKVGVAPENDRRSGVQKPKLGRVKVEMKVQISFTTVAIGDHILSNSRGGLPKVGL